jgi:aquaporin Z
MNPAVTLCFLRLGRISPRDAAGFIAGQVVGALLAMTLMSVVLSRWLSDPSVHYVTTRPGPLGPEVAWVAEFVITLVLMSVVLTLNRRPKLAPRTGFFTATLILIYITFESPLSGMSMNPARSLGSAATAGTWSSLWVYFTAPPLGMLAAVELQRLLGVEKTRLCGKLTHSPWIACVFPCNCLEPHGIALPVHPQAATEEQPCTTT